MERARTRAHGHQKRTVSSNTSERSLLKACSHSTNRMQCVTASQRQRPPSARDQRHSITASASASAQCPRSASQHHSVSVRPVPAISVTASQRQRPLSARDQRHSITASASAQCPRSASQHHSVNQRPMCPPNIRSIAVSVIGTQGH
ncbi:hypothetical protein NDU88_001165 [Pleurodeles waltl]|uniref:Uncharacterized protein n=1 Tax=Pleurodeles waltl TaxID=8319 RepID=A0AAV7MMP7_PLEWA|nr:hypothetical protein NDU88_001165 [Pleurodeles waltl]